MNLLENTWEGNGDKFAPLHRGSPSRPEGVHAGKCNALAQPLQHTDRHEEVRGYTRRRRCDDGEERSEEDARTKQVLPTVLGGEITTRYLCDDVPDG